MNGFSTMYKGQKLYFSEGQCNYLRTIQRYRNLGTQAAERYRATYANYQKFSIFANKGMELGYQLIDEYLTSAVKDLVSHGYYDVSKEILVNNYGDYLYESWESIDDEIQSECEQSKLSIEGDRQRRQLRKASRGRIVGGGFGVKGAAKGIALAGAVNGVSGLFHSGANAIGNTMSRVAQEKRLNDIYRSKQMIDTLQLSIYTCIARMGDMVLDYKGARTADAIVGTAEMNTKVRALMGNFRQIPPSAKPKAAVDMLMLDPHNIDVYRLLLETFKDEDGALYQLVETITVPFDYIALVKAICYSNIEVSKLQMLNMELGRVPYSSPDFHNYLGRVKTKYYEDCFQAFVPYGILDRQKLRYALKAEFDKIDAVVNKYASAELQTRTFGDVTYETPDMAKLAEKTTLQVQQLVKGCTISDEQSVASTVQKLEDIKQSVPSHADFATLSRNIDGMIVHIKRRAADDTEKRRKADIEERTWHGHVYETVALKRAAIQEHEAQQKAIADEKAAKRMFAVAGSWISTVLVFALLCVMPFCEILGTAYTGMDLLNIVVDEVVVQDGVKNSAILLASMWFVILPIMVLSLLREKNAKRRAEALVVVVAMLIMILMGCGLAGSDVNTSTLCKVVTILSFAGGTFFTKVYSKN